MTTEQAIKYLNLYIKINDKRAIPLTKEELKFKLEENFTQKVSEAIQVVLKELDKKDDVINEMAGMINTRDFGDICNQFGKYQNCSNYIKEGLCEKCIKDYFYKKVEEQE